MAILPSVGIVEFPVVKVTYTKALVFPLTYRLEGLA